ncbi:RNA polymerase sigma-70 factor [Plebeiibacterium sediminum]|uniref:RNA polymerase sigma-70 factor n=1 Tax=Plebeiibacterium sediminum TaxID=2992112 RepID=A0AAE3M5W3_9BACT|nr:RNA polymerase sigma-70 factor [Plebeiobacterium sediminum]MCW3787702.1 RNA polymerase sigma-70 factor [Plebeiobacterium sediminum]
MPVKQHNIGTDALVFEKIKNGDEKAFEKVFRDNYVHLVAFANTFLHDIDSAENIVQNIFVKLWENRKQYNISSIKGYLMISVRNSCNNEIKRIYHERTYQHSIENDEMIESINYSDSRVMDKISSIINQLPEQRKKIFKLNRLEGLKYREIAVKLNISPKTVEIQMGKALKFLRENLLELKKQVYHMLW